MDSDAYLPAILARDTRAFGAWMAGAEPAIRDSLRSFAAVVDTEAVLQEAMLRVWSVAPRFVPDGAPNGLLRLGVRIARNLAVSETRRMRAKPVADEELARVPAEVPSAPDPLLRRAIAECRDRLPDKPRAALDARLASGGGADDTELASGLAMRLNTFLQNVTRARRLLAECLGKRGVDVEAELGA